MSGKKSPETLLIRLNDPNLVTLMEALEFQVRREEHQANANLEF